MEMVICQETPSHGKKIYGNLTAARHAPSKKVQITKYYVILMCAFLSVKKNYGKIRPRRAAVVCWPMPNLFSISIILSVTIYIYTYGNGSKPCSPGEHQNRWQTDVHPLTNCIYRYWSIAICIYIYILYILWSRYIFIVRLKTQPIEARGQADVVWSDFRGLFAQLEPNLSVSRLRGSQGCHGGSSA